MGERAHDSTRQFWTLFGIIAGGWTLFGLFSFSNSLVYYRLPDADLIPWGRLFVGSMVSAWIWALLTPAALWVSWRLRLEPGRRLRTVLSHFVAGCCFVVVATVLERWFVDLLDYRTPVTFVRGLLYRFDSRFLAYVAIVTVAEAWRSARLYRARELRAAELETRLARTQLQILKMQLQPHFLFNTLNSIAELVHTDAGAADAMITRLGRLLRLSLDHQGHQVVPLRHELDMLAA
ncbi:MAG: histidine kinase [Gemmatimonadota bacterium]